MGKDSIVHVGGLARTGKEDGMDHNTLTHLRRLDAGERDRALAHAYAMHKRDGIAASDRSAMMRLRSLIAGAIRAHTRMMERFARALEAAHPSSGGEHAARVPERNAP